VRVAEAALVALIALAVSCDDHCARTTTIQTAQGPQLVCLRPLACGDVNAQSTDLRAPVILDADLASQLEQDPWTIVLTMDFADTDGNLAAGAITFYLGSSAGSAATQDLLSSFKQSALAETATSGTLVLPLRFDETVRNGAQVDLGMQVVDGEGLHSNCYGLTLAFEVNET
jgi:hypothetical protein